MIIGLASLSPILPENPDAPRSYLSDQRRGTGKALYSGIRRMGVLPGDFGTSGFFNARGGDYSG